MEVQTITCVKVAVLGCAMVIAIGLAAAAVFVIKNVLGYSSFHAILSLDPDSILPLLIAGGLLFIAGLLIFLSVKAFRLKS